MNVSPISSAHAGFAAQTEAQDARRKIADSCRQFEGVLWRQFLEKSLQPLLSQPSAEADKTGTYGYFLSNTISEAVSGGPQSFAAMLEAQLAPPPSKSTIH
jgi:hypothetical protein